MKPSKTPNPASDPSFPLAYLEGHTWFYGRKFLSDSRALIPRPETEALIDTTKAFVANLQKSFSAIFPPARTATYIPDAPDKVAVDEVRLQSLPERQRMTCQAETGIDEKELLKFAPTILDLGTGSGIIAITLALELPSAHITATDISAEALSLARENATLYSVKNKITFIQSDLFNNKYFSKSEFTSVLKNELKGKPEKGNVFPFQSEAKRFDIIIANLPYVDTSWPWLDHPALSHEPTQALFAEDHGLALIKQLITEAKPHLTPTGALLLEHDPSQFSALSTFATSHHFTPTSITPYTTLLTQYKPPTAPQQ